MTPVRFSSFPLPLSFLPELSDDEAPSGPPAPSSRLRAVRKADTNVCAVQLGTLADPAVALATGDATFCSSCSAALTKFSKYDKNQHLWNCEYCGTLNSPVLEEEEIPKVDSIDYLIKPPPEAKSADETAVVYCIDISGSMGVTSEVTGELKIKVLTPSSAFLNSPWHLAPTR